MKTIPGTKIHVKEVKNIALKALLKENEFVVSMRDRRSNEGVVEMLDKILVTYRDWAKATRENFTNVDAEEWGMETIGEVIRSGAAELADELRTAADFLEQQTRNER